MAMIAITTSSSINVNPDGKRRLEKTGRSLPGRWFIFMQLQASRANAGNKAKRAFASDRGFMPKPYTTPSAFSLWFLIFYFCFFSVIF